MVPAYTRLWSYQRHSTTNTSHRDILVVFGCLTMYVSCISVTHVAPSIIGAPLAIKYYFFFPSYSCSFPPRETVTAAQMQTDVTGTHS